METKELSYEPHILKLHTKAGFISRYFNLIQDYGTNEAAYEAAERQYKHFFGERKYSDYDSFRVVLSRYNKAQKSNKSKNKK